MSSDIKNIGINASNTAKKIAKLPRWKTIQTYLSSKKITQGKSFPAGDQTRLDTINGIVGQMEKCSGAA